MRVDFTTLLVITGTTLFLLCGRGHAASESEALEQLKNCARTADRAVRIACYESLGQRVLREEPIKTADVSKVEPEAVETVSPEPEPQRLPDKLGIEKREEKQAAQKKSHRGHVRSCGQRSDDKWYFVFDSGQVWKQSSDGNYRFNECDFDVTITKDFFGYKMKIDGGKSIRVRRER